METFESIISIFLMLVLFTDLAAAYLLLRGAVRTDYSFVALNERAFVALSQGFSASLLALLGANRILSLHLPNEFVLLALSVALLIQALPGIVWLSLYFNNKFNERQARRASDGEDID